MSKNIKKILKEKINSLLETKGFEHMEVAFGVKHKSDNLSDEEKKQFGSLEQIQDKESGVIKLGEPPVQSALNKVHKEDKKDAYDYYKKVAERMVNFQKTDESEPSQIGENIDINKMSENEFLEKMLGPNYKEEDLEKITATIKAYEDLKKANINEVFKEPKVNREDDQTEPEDVYDTEALGTGMQALKYDDEGTKVYDEFEERIDDLNDEDATYEKLKKYSEKYLKHKYEDPDEYHYSPKVRATDKAIQNEGTINESYKKYSDVIKENIFKVKGNIKSKDQIIRLVDKLPSRVRVDETVFAVTDGENYYRLIWEGSEDGEAIITHEKNTNIVNESINKMKHLWEFKSSDSISTNKNISENNNDVFFSMMNKLRNK